MPYIKQDERDAIDIGCTPANAGGLNYLLSMTVLNYIKSNGNRYQQINDAIGALEGCKLELYRRLAAPYEDQKIIDNGDLF